MIRPAVLEDLPRLIFLSAEMHRESRFRDYLFDEGKVGQWLTMLLTNKAGDCFAWVAENDGQVVGGLLAQCYELWYSRQKVATDYGLFMHPLHRGGAAALRLVKQFKAWAKEQDAICELGCNTGVNPEMFDKFMGALGFLEVAKLYQARN